MIYNRIYKKYFFYWKIRKHIDFKLNIVFVFNLVQCIECQLNLIFTIQGLTFVYHDDGNDDNDEIIPGYNLCSQFDSGSVVNQYQLLLLPGDRNGDGRHNHPNVHKYRFWGARCDEGCTYVVIYDAYTRELKLNHTLWLTDVPFI